MAEDNKKSKIEKLLAEIGRLKKELKKKKKYGLVWEDKPEDVFEMCKEKLPVLKEVKGKEIITDKNKPVNLLIEGDNYHALSVLNYTHKGKIDIIYIDPPYNTGKKKEWKFNDHWIDENDVYRHSKWISFMEKRIKLAKSLLKDTGVIFISIDDNEMAQLKLLMDDQNKGLFGEKNFVNNFMWLHGKGKKTKQSRTLQQYILCYAKNKHSLNEWIDIKFASGTFSNPDNDSRGNWFSGSISFSEERSNKQNENYFTIKSPTEISWTRQWQCDEEEMHEYLADKKIYFGPSPDYSNVPRLKIFPNDTKEIIPNNIIDNVGSTRGAQKELDEIIGKKENGKSKFENPKPPKLIEFLCSIVNSTKDIIVLDFFAGSGTTAQAVLDLKKNGGNCQFILCTNNENNIATDVCYPRIKKIIEGYENLKGKKINGLGGNLKYFKADEKTFVDAKPTDKNKIKLTKEAVEMLCVKEGTFEPVIDKKDFKIFKNHEHYTGIIFNQLAISAFKKAIVNIKGKFSIYIFSLGDDDFIDEFEDMKQKVKLSPIPEAILKVYRRIFK